MKAVPALRRVSRCFVALFKKTSRLTNTVNNEHMLRECAKLVQRNLKILSEKEKEKRRM